MKHEESAAATEPARSRTAWLMFAPLFAVLLLRFVLATWAESLPDAQPLRAVQALDDADVGAVMWQAALPVLLTLSIAAASLLALWLSVRVWGWRRVAPRLAVLWLALCAAAAAALTLQHLNRAALQPLPEVTATVVQARPYPSSERGPGGAQTVLMLSGNSALRRVLLLGADARALPPGRALRLSLARGRLWGQYVTGSDAPAAPRAE
ncbi:MAG: hypothetical protein LBE78_00500 [Burkholderiaceae bacterium]|jgi:hypothetical protein|nr:hypothetical protein [Burkholderiaceae bacterium]